MAGTRITIDLFIQDPMPQAVVKRLPQIREGIRWLMSFTTPLPEGGGAKAVYHKCFHDGTPAKPCEPEQDI